MENIIIITRFFVCECTAGDLRNSGVALHHAGHNDLRIAPLGFCVLDELTAGDGGIAVNQNGRSITTAGGIIQRELAAVDRER